MKKREFLVALGLLPILVFGQMSMNGWRTHLSYNSVSLIEQTPNKVFAVSDGAMMSVDKTEGVVDLYSTLTDMTELSVCNLAYNSNTQSMFIAYENGNIDIMNSDGITNIPELMQKAYSVSKVANDIFIDGNYAYMSCGVGVVVVNMQKKEITDTYVLGANSSFVSANSTVIFNDSIYVFADSLVYGSNKDNLFLSNYQNWDTISSFPLPAELNKKALVFNDKLYLLKDSGEVYVTSDMESWSLFDASKVYTNIRVSDDRLLLISSYSLVNYDEDLSKETLSGLRILDGVYSSSDDMYWLAADTSGVMQVKDQSLVGQYMPDGPATNDIFALKYTGGRMFALTGGPRDTQDDGRMGAVMIFENEEWKNIVKKDVKPYSNKNFIELTSIAIDENDPTHFFVSSFREGLYEFKNDTYYNRYNYLNSSIDNAELLSKDDYNVVDGVCIDKNNNVWMNNPLAKNVGSSGLKVLLEDGTWVENYYSSTNSKGAWDDAIVTSNNFKWQTLAYLSWSPGGVLIVDDNDHPESSAYHSSVFYDNVTDQDGNIISLEKTYSIVEDLDGDVWVGTSEGPVIFQNIDNVFNSGYTVYRPKISRDDGTDYADYLLDGQPISALAVDGGNRKWIGTDGSGVYLMSADGLTTIQHFTKTNSPLFSNSILAIDVNDETGEVFIATDLGLLSFMSDATEGQDDYSSINIYPNPVRKDFDGLITFEGMMDETVFKITDAYGNLVYQGEANGGTATWDGYTANGEKASAGVYFIMCSDSAGSNTDNISTEIGKFLIIR